MSKCLSFEMWDYVEECRQLRDLIIQPYVEDILVADEDSFVLPKDVYDNLQKAAIEYAIAFDEASRRYKPLGEPPTLTRILGYYTPKGFVKFECSKENSWE